MQLCLVFNTQTSSSVHSTDLFFYSQGVCKNGYIMLNLQKSKESVTNATLKYFPAPASSSPSPALHCPLSDSIVLFSQQPHGRVPSLSLTPFPLSCSLTPSVTNAYPLGGYSLHHLTSALSTKSEGRKGRNHGLALALISILMKCLTDEML